MADEIAERPGTGGGPGKGTVRYHDETDGSYSMAEASHLRYWNTSSLTWERTTGSAGALSTTAGTGGSGPVTIADGADVAEGTTSDAAWVSGNGTVISLLKKIASAGGSAVSIADGADVAQGTTTDTAAASTVIGLLKNIKAALAGTLSTARTWTLSSGTDSVDTELPAAAALADGAANPTTPTVGAAMLGIASGLWYRITAAQPNFDGVAGTSIGLLTAAFAHVWNGTGWDRLKGDTTSGAWVNVKNASIPVTGTFWQATQPVSGPLTDTQLRASAVPVSGTFFQATQPVSLATNTPDVTDRAARLLGHVTVDSAPTTAVTGPLTDAQLRATSVPVTAALATDTIGLAKDATLGVVSDSPGVYTVIDQLTQIRKTSEAELTALQALVAASKPAAVKKTQTTLLHRS